MGTLVTLDIDYTGLEGVHYWIFVICLCHIWAYFVLEAIHINRGYSKFAHAKTPPLLGMSVLPLTVFLHSLNTASIQLCCHITSAFITDKHLSGNTDHRWSKFICSVHLPV